MSLALSVFLLLVAASAIFLQPPAQATSGFADDILLGCDREV